MALLSWSGTHSVLFPEQLQRDAVALEFAVNVRVVRPAAVGAVRSKPALRMAGRIDGSLGRGH